MQADALVDVPVRADRHKLEQVVLNLVHNALKFTPERGRLIVRSDVTKDLADDYGRGYRLRDSEGASRKSL